MEEKLRLEIKACGCELLERFLPRLVVAASSEESISKLIHLAGPKRLRLIATGTGSSFPANYQPPPNTIFLLTLGLNAILELRFDDAMAVLQAGTLVSALREKIEGTALELPSWVADYAGTMGGAMLGPDAAGRRHAEMRRRLLGVELVDARGQMVRFGGCTVKNVAGYDYWTFLVGTAGRFGVLTKLILNLERMPVFTAETSTQRPGGKTDEAHRWIIANLEKRLDPDGIFAR
ncbi:MAG TPA: FAD-binding oxidoreductase [bacterium]|jgi:glycolate oxidase